MNEQGSISTRKISEGRTEDAHQGSAQAAVAPTGGSQGQAVAEEWRAVTGFGGKYQVSNTGRVRTVFARGKAIIPRALSTRKRFGYPQVGLCLGGKARTMNIHVLVAAAFHGPRPAGMHVCHINGDRSDSRAENLMYGSPALNVQHTMLHGRVRHGENHSSHKLSDELVAAIYSQARAGVFQKDVASAFGVARQTVSDISRGVRWKHLGLVARHETQPSI